MRGKFRAITQVSCALLLALSLSLMTAVAVTGTELPSISPTEAEYDLDDPAEVTTMVTWGVASEIDSITDDDGYRLQRGMDKDYVIHLKNLIILDAYLGDKLTDIEEEVTLIISFDVGGAELTISATGTHPSISPATDDYDLDDPEDVSTTIVWGAATALELIMDDEGEILQRGVDYKVDAIDASEAKLTISHEYYLQEKLTDIGEGVELTIIFDRGDAVTFDITAIGTGPSIYPQTREYELDAPTDVRTIIAWGAANEVESIVDGDGYELLPGDYTLATFDAERSTLTIKNSYLASRLEDIGDSVVLTIDFGVSDDATFTITAEGTQPRLSPPGEEYNLDTPADVKATIIWGAANEVESIVDGDDYELLPGDYTLATFDAARATLTIRNSYLASRLEDIGDSAVLTIEFDVGNDATFTITAEGTQPKLSPPGEEYDLDTPADVKTIITWNTATEVVSIVDDDGYKLDVGDYSVTYINGMPTLTVFGNPYLKGKLTDVGAQAVLTVKFDIGADTTFTITAEGTQPKLSPATEEYDLDAPADVETIIWWGVATEVGSIMDGDNYALVENVDYSLITIADDRATLTIFHDPYLKGELTNIGNSVILTIEFDANEVTFTITAEGTQPTISPTTAEYGIIAQNNVSTNITWGTATSVVSIVDGAGFELIEDEHYTVTSIDANKATLTILNDEYLQGKLTNVRQELVLTIDFDVSSDHPFTIRAINEACFIATAAYGTPMAEEIQILRELRDEYLLTNPLGQALVGVYYRVSPPIAEFITAHPSLKPVVRAGLVPVVAMSAIAVNTTPADKVAIVGLLVLASMAVAVWVTRRRGRGPEYT